jgi:DedD protein
MAEQQKDVDTLKRRGRRRLVGAVALVLLAVIVLPMVFDPEPRRTPPPVSVRIPGEDDSSFTPKIPAKPAPKIEEKKAPEAKLEEKAPPKPEAKKPEAKKPEGKTEPKVAERARAEAALANGEFVVPVGAFANADPVVAKLDAAKVPYFTQQIATANGTVTRVRAGPFATKREADKALETLKGLGFKPGSVSTKAAG